MTFTPPPRPPIKGGSDLTLDSVTSAEHAQVREDEADVGLGMKGGEARLADKSVQISNVAVPAEDVRRAGPVARRGGHDHEDGAAHPALLPAAADAGLVLGQFLKLKNYELKFPTRDQGINSFTLCCKFFW